MAVMHPLPAVEKIKKLRRLVNGRVKPLQVNDARALSLH
jgi:hypothetical protein